jgi:hypothetical protein
LATIRLHGLLMDISLYKDREDQNIDEMWRLGLEFWVFRARGGGDGGYVPSFPLGMYLP